MNKFIQFELWKDCSQGCRFCFNKGQIPVNKTESCKYVLENLKKLKEGQYDYIGIIGGEFFNGETIYHVQPFLKILRQAYLLKPKKIFLTTSLIYDIGEYLIPALKALKNGPRITDKLVLCTSWDAKYRFHTPEQQALWTKNMLWIYNHFPEVELHVEMILTQHLIDMVLNKELNFALFKQIFNCSLDFIEPSSGLYYTDKHACQKDIPGFFPTKASFIKFLMAIRDQIDLNTFLSMDVRSNELHFYEDGCITVAKDRRNNAGVCKLKDKTRKYDIGFIDSKDKMREVVVAFNELYGDVDS